MERVKVVIFSARAKVMQNKHELEMKAYINKLNRRETNKGKGEIFEAQKLSLEAEVGPKARTSIIIPVVQSSPVQFAPVWLARGRTQVKSSFSFVCLFICLSIFSLPFSRSAARRTIDH